MRPLVLALFVLGCQNGPTAAPSTASKQSHATPATAPVDGAAVETAVLPARGTPCAQGKCAQGLSCIEYFGIAGPKGPTFSSCETRCGPKSPCPAGLACRTIADGPGSVCR